MEVKARAKYIRISPQKTRLVADLIRGLIVGEALNILSITRKKSAKIVEKVVKSAVANAVHNSKVKNIDEFRVKSIFIDGGPVWKRQMPRARGSANMIRKKTSHIEVTLADEV